MARARNGRLRAAFTGATIKHLTGKSLASYPVPLPPLAEQERIVAKVDELMQLCDDLEARQQARQHITTRLRASSLVALTNAETNEELHTAWSRIHTNWEALIDQPDSVEALRHAILRLAMRGAIGRLGAQDHAEDVPVGDVVSLQNGYAFKSDWYSSDGVRLVRCQNIGHGELHWDESRMLEHDRVAEFSRFELSAGDIVLALDRPLISTGLKVARITEHDLPCLLLQRVARLTPDASRLDHDYFWLWLHSDQFMGSIDPGRSNGVPHISTREVAALPIRLPSLQTQRSIVDETSQLLKLCDEVRARSDQAQHLSTRFAESAMREVVVSGG